MKKIKSILNAIIKKFKQHEFQLYYDHLEQFVLTAFRSKHGIWGMLGIYLVLGLLSLVWIFSTSHHHFYYQDEQEFVKAKPAMPANLDANRLFAEPPRRGEAGFNINCRLEAILFNDDVKKREVLLKLPSGESKTFHVGDELPDGVKVLDIQVFKVKLEKNGQEKILRLEEYKSDFLSDQPKSSQSLF